MTKIQVWILRIGTILFVAVACAMPCARYHYSGWWEQTTVLIFSGNWKELRGFEYCARLGAVVATTGLAMLWTISPKKK